MKQKIFISSLIAIFLISFLMTNVLAQIPNCSDYANDGYDCYSYDKCDPSTQIDALCSNQDYACCKPQVAGDKNNTSFSIENPLGETSDIYSLIDLITKFLIGLAIVITPIIIVYAGFLYITAAGNEEKVKTAQKVLIWALIGFALVLIATGVPALIKQFLGTQGCSTDEKCGEYEKCFNQQCVDVCKGIDCAPLKCVPIGNHEYDCQSAPAPTP